MNKTSANPKKISLQGVDLSYYSHGTGQVKVLILHGFGSSIASWENFISFFPKDKYTVIFPELPGFGGSSNPPTAWQVADYANFIEDFIQSIQFKPDFLICHSFGGRISIELLSRSNPIQFQKAAFVAAAGIRPKLSLGRKIISWFGKSLNFLKTVPLIGTLYTKIVVKFRKFIGAADYNQVSGTMQQTFINVINTDLTSKMPDIKIPVDLFWGTHDKYTPLQMGKTMNQLIPNSNLHIYNNKKHGLHLTMPEQLYSDITKFFHD